MSTHGISVPKVTVTLSDSQIAWLNETAIAYSTSVSDIVRRLIDETRGAYLTPPDARTAHDAVQAALLAVSSNSGTS